MCSSLPCPRCAVLWCHLMWPCWGRATSALGSPNGGAEVAVSQPSAGFGDLTRDAITHAAGRSTELPEAVEQHVASAPQRLLFLDPHLESCPYVTIPNIKKHSKVFIYGQKFEIHLNSSEISQLRCIMMSEKNVLCTVLTCNLRSVGQNQITSLFLVSVYQVFLKLGTPLLSFFKPHDVGRLGTGTCHEEAALFWCFFTLSGIVHFKYMKWSMLCFLSHKIFRTLDRALSGLGLTEQDTLCSGQ